MQNYCWRVAFGYYNIKLHRYFSVAFFWLFFQFSVKDFRSRSHSSWAVLNTKIVWHCSIKFIGMPIAWYNPTFHSNVRGTTYVLMSSTSGRASAKKRPFTTAEKDIIDKYLDSFIRRKEIPSKSDIEALLCAEPQMERTWRNIKDYCRNRIITMSKK